MVRKIVEDENSQIIGSPINVHTIYDHIKSSNSSLKRRSKTLLEDSIERALQVLKDSRNESDSEDEKYFQVDESNQDTDVCPVRKLHIE